MAAGLLLLQPSLALGAAQYRIDALPAAKTLSGLFGYQGAMFPWTSAAGGYAFGCCDGNKHGEGFEDCIEQHITPDVSFALQQVSVAFICKLERCSTRNIQFDTTTPAALRRYRLSTGGIGSGLLFWFCNVRGLFLLGFSRHWRRRVVAFFGLPYSGISGGLDREPCGSQRRQGPIPYRRHHAY